MAEENQEFTEQESGVDGGVSKETAPSTAQDPEGGQPEKKAKVNLDEIPEFREWKSRTDRDMARMNQEIQAERQRVAAEQERIRQERMAGMDDFERAQFERDEYAQRAGYAEQRLATIEAERYRDQRVAEIQQRVAAETGVNVPRDQLDLSSPDSAVTSAYQFAVRQLRSGQAQTVQEEAQQLAQRNQANRVDLGGGAPNVGETRTRAKLNEMKRKGAPSVDIFTEALKAGRR